MTLLNITNLLFKKYQKRTGKVNVFNVSEIYGITHGYISVEEYLNGKPLSFQEAIRMSNGVAKHKQIQELFLNEDGWEIEKKIEYQPQQYEWSVVGKADLIKGDVVYEIKTSDKLLKTSKPWHECQLKIYLFLFDKKEGWIVQPIIKNQNLFLKKIGKVKRNDEFVLKEFQKLNEFYQKIKKIQAVPK